MKDPTQALIQKLNQMNLSEFSPAEIVPPPTSVADRLFDQVFPPTKVDLFLHTIPNANAEALVVSDSSGYIEWVSPAFSRMCGYTLAELRGQKAGKMLQGAETDPQSVETLRSGVRDQRYVETEIVNYHKSGGRYEVNIGLWPLLNDGGECHGFVAVEHQLK